MLMGSLTVFLVSPVFLVSLMPLMSLTVFTVGTSPLLSRYPTLAMPKGWDMPLDSPGCLLLPGLGRITCP